MRKATRKTLRRLLTMACLGLLAWQQTACAKNPDNQLERPTCDMSSFMVLGDSIAFGYMAGYTGADGDPLPQVSPELVVHAWPKLVADQAGVEMGLTFYTNTPDNLSVPGYALNDMTVPYSSLLAANEVTKYVLGGYAAISGEDPSPLQVLLTENPSTAAVMIGNNDILGAAIYANSALKTPVNAFTAMYSNLVAELAAAPDRAVVTATIPDVSAIPFLLSAPQAFDGEEIPAGIASNEDGTAYAIQESDYITLQGMEKLKHSLPLIKCPGSATPSLACVGDILTEDELEEISAHTEAFNNAIRAIADHYDNVAIMAFDKLFRQLSRHGIVIQGRKYTLEYDGGLISKDGIHPTKLGHGVIANKIIQTLNSRFGADIPKLVLNTLAAEEELAEGSLPLPASFDSQAFEHARKMFRKNDRE
ncbi:MAG: SGNH/GDSL hydrolase family protein [Candidatus Electrothrix sp. GW3-4]|uniref:SGNH/GDSL hydrolase family protein n=1 Tax=Candidatus Electrothrix sp. GW3-4 TaxID=3126740 RepID=UPI0030D55BBC